MCRWPALLLCLLPLALPVAGAPLSAAAVEEAEGR
jgi:hypothetical protein